MHITVISFPDFAWLPIDGLAGRRAGVDSGALGKLLPLGYTKFVQLKRSST